MALKSNALTTVARAAAYLGIDTPASSSVEYTVFENLINTVTSQIENYIGYQVKLKTYSDEQFSTQDGESLALNAFPVISVDAFHRRTSATNEDDWEPVDSVYYHTNLATGLIYATRGLRFAEGRYGYRITYTAGYDYDNVTTFLSDTAGGDIELAAWMSVAALWHRRKQVSGVKSERIGDYSVTYGGGGTVYDASFLNNPDIQAILDKYARLDVSAPLTPIQI